jgi:RNA polymerase sigma-70 factor (ECF subfamily)
MVMTTATERNQQIRALYERERDRLFRAALRVGGGRRAFAEDVVHDVFVKLLTGYEGLDDNRDLGGYLYRSTMNGCFSRLRKEAVRNNPLVALLLGSQTAPGPGADVRARLDGVQREAVDALALLPGRERVAFCMVRLDDAPLADVAQVLGCSVPTACKLVQRAEAILGRAGWGASSSASAAMPASSVSAHKAVAHG